MKKREHVRSSGYARKKLRADKVEDIIDDKYDEDFELE